MPSMAARQHDDLSRWPGTATGKSVPSSRQKGRTPPDDSAYGRCTPIAYTNRNPQARRKRVGLSPRQLLRHRGESPKSYPPTCQRPQETHRDHPLGPREHMRTMAIGRKTERHARLLNGSLRASSSIPSTNTAIWNTFFVLKYERPIEYENDLKKKRPRFCEACVIWSGQRGSNPRPQPWQGCALPTEPCPQMVGDTRFELVTPTVSR